MTCEYCGRANCNAARLSGARMIECVRDCRNATRDRALRAEAVAAAGIDAAANIHASSRLSMLTNNGEARAFLNGAMAVRDAMVAVNKALRGEA